LINFDVSDAASRAGKIVNDTDTVVGAVLPHFNTCLNWLG